MSEEIEVVNLVGLLDFDCSFNIDYIHSNIEGFRTENPEKHHWLKTYDVETGQYIAFYQSGKCMVAGVTSVEELKHYASLVEEKLGDLGIDVDASVEVKNIVAQGGLSERASLEKLAIYFGLEQTEYEPEVFPGLIYRPKDVKLVFLVFASGKVVCTGGTDREVVVDQLDSFIDELSGLVTDMVV